MHEEVEHLQHTVNDQLEQVLAKMGSASAGEELASKVITARLPAALKGARGK